jgi:hypothetical protein
MAEKRKSNILMPKIDIEFNLASRNLPDLFKKTTESIEEKIWKQTFGPDVDLTALKGYDYDLNTPLEQLKNKKLVHSLLLHYLGRGIFCSKAVNEKFKLLLKKRIKDSTNELDQSKYKCETMKLQNKSNHTVEEILAPYNQLPNDFQKWLGEKITWDQHVVEISFKEMLLKKVTEKCSKYDLKDSGDFFTDFLANLQLDNFCYKSLKSARGYKEMSNMCERTTNWIFPLDIQIKVEQRREIYSYRRDSVMAKGKKEYFRLQMDNLTKDLDPYMHGGHIRSIFDNEPLEQEYYLKKHPGRQLIGEVAFIMFGVEVQKCPAALIYNMMILDLIDGDKVSQREVFYSNDPEHPKDKGYGGISPYSMNGATTALRFLNIYYSYIFDHWYSYDITEESEEIIFENLMSPSSEYNTSKNYKILFEEVMQREYDLINKWITFKKERDRKARYLKTILELYNYIFRKTYEFYEQYKFSVK